MKPVYEYWKNERGVITIKDFWKCALVRAIRTFCQSLVTLIGTEAVNIIDIDWLTILGIAATTAVMSILTSIATGLPESE